MIIPVIIILVAAGVILVIVSRRLPQIKAVLGGDRDKVNNGQPDQFWTDQGSARLQDESPAIGQQELAKTTPESAGQLIEAADRLFRRGSAQQAEQLYLKAATLEPNNPKIYNRLGVIYLDSKNYEDAKEAFLSALKFDNRVASRHFNLAMAYLAMGKRSEGITALRQAVELDEGNEKYKNLLRQAEGGGVPS